MKLENVLHPVLLVLGRRTFNLIYATICTFYFIALCAMPYRLILLVWGRRVSGLYITAACTFVLLWELYPMTAGPILVEVKSEPQPSICSL
ncbi:hypothetical protein C1645_305494 [Glomus cerebriforme]|uniref:Uncharacterized protein n=1 Tax=Glomus cerebriforme TaxID=658196 RepID=A0A397SWD7_9GLOM|nr:hypothetical protein C1645_305494 [Glomus cerebriforme]